MGKEKTIDKNVAVIIKKNDTKLWKRYIVEWYKKGKLMATQPVNHLDDIERKYFNF